MEKKYSLQEIVFKASLINPYIKLSFGLTNSVEKYEFEVSESHLNRIKDKLNRYFTIPELLDLQHLS